MRPVSRITPVARAPIASMLALASVALAAACHGKGGDPAHGAASAASASAAPPVVLVKGPAAAKSAAPPPDTPKVIAIASPTPIFSATEWPPKDPDKAQDERKGVIRLGYMRNGETVAVKPGVIKKSNCPEGWYELLEGGFICGQFVTTDPNNPELADGKRLHPPLMDGPLPYQYGLNITNGTPLYRRVPTRRERKEVEKGLLVGKSRPGDLARAQAAARADDGSVPWYLQDHNGERPQVSLDDIKGQRALVLLRMVKGFYISIDRKATSHSGLFWKTTSQAFAPVEHIVVHKSKIDFQGIDFSKPGETRKLPIGWMLNPHGWKYDIDEAAKKAKRHDHVDRFTAVELTGKKVVIDNRNYYETKEGWWMRDIESTRTDPGPPPSDLAPGEKWIDVNIRTQTLVAFEGDKPFYATLISSGRHNDKDPKQDHRTVTGSFRIIEKHIAATMDSDTVADGPYSIQDVPWIQYFKGSYALHGAFWHSRFGHERSHGCVNLEPIDAKNLFFWTGPRLPDGWHGVDATENNPGTRVIVHD